MWNRIRYLFLMRQACERIIPLGDLSDPVDLADRLEREAESMRAQGWFYVTSAADGLLENMTLFFEREVDS